VREQNGDWYDIEFCTADELSFVERVLDEFPAPPGSAYPGSRPGEPGYGQDQRPGGTRPYGQDQRPSQDQRQGQDAFLLCGFIL